MISTTLQKLKAFRMTIPSLILLVFASYRTLTSGDSIQLVGICAAVVPFICQFKNFNINEKVPPIIDVISSYILNFILMIVYLLWILILTWIGQNYIPGYITNPHFNEILFIALAADVIFISAVIPICRELKPMQRMIPGLVLTNALLIFMMMAGSFVKSISLTKIPVISIGFSMLVIFLTFSMIFVGYSEGKEK